MGFEKFYGFWKIYKIIYPLLQSWYRTSRAAMPKYPCAASSYITHVPTSMPLRKLLVVFYFPECYIERTIQFHSSFFFHLKKNLRFIMSLQTSVVPTIFRKEATLKIFNVIFIIHIKILRFNDKSRAIRNPKENLKVNGRYT